MAHAAADPASLLRRENINLPAGAGQTLSNALLGLGGAFLAITAVGAATGEAHAASVALAGYHTGFLVVTGWMLGSMALVMMLHQINAGWSATVRRPLEHVMSLAPLCAVLFIPVLIFSGALFHWMDPHHTQGDPVYEAKSAYLNTPFFVVRALLYFGLWLWLAGSLYRFSRRQDEDGDRWHTAHARRRSSYGLVILALTTAFAGFDWMMSLDYHWFSTMFGVYFFAGYIGASLALTTLILIALRRVGALQGLITVEHFHDIGKLLFGFAVFWAYIGFSQYFLIWYGNLPEETGWFLVRRTDGWMPYNWALAIGRFAVPFILLMPRFCRRSVFMLGVMSVWILIFHMLDVHWVVRPTVQGVESTMTWLDVAGALGPVLVFLGFVVRKLASAPLIPVNDPRLAEAMVHKNYV